MKSLNRKTCFYDTQKMLALGGGKLKKKKKLGLIFINVVE